MVEITADDFFYALIEALDHDRDVFEYQSDLFRQNGECGRIHIYDRGQILVAVIATDHLSMARSVWKSTYWT